MHSLISTIQVEYPLATDN